ncbi:MAG: hypothetical protein ABGZ17_04165, partial [Planctomycetaceae bacterium]
HWFYTVLGVGMATLVCCALGVRTALNARSLMETPRQATAGPKSNVSSPGRHESTPQFEPQSRVDVPPSDLSSSRKSVHTEYVGIPTTDTPEPLANNPYLVALLLLCFMFFAFMALTLVVG